MWRGAAGSLRRAWGVPGRPWSSGGSAASDPRGAPSCWNCGGQRASVGGDALFCSACRALQPPSPEPDFFRLMDCGRSFTVDVRKLQHRYQQLQRQVHPDNFSQKSQTERDFSEQHSTLVNEAYRTLLTPISRGLYLLKLHGMEIPEGTDSSMDMEFLGEIMEVNEKLAEAHNEAATEEIGAFVRAHQAALQALIGGFLALRGHTAISTMSPPNSAKQKELTEDLARAFEQGDLQKAMKLLGKMKYFSNLDEKVKIKKTST